MEETTTPTKIDLGCGSKKKEGFYGVDLVQCPGVDLVLDLFKFPWPWPDNSVDEVFSSHFIEHIPHACACSADHIDPFLKFLDEVWRILKPGGKATLIGPYYTSMGAWQDPTHARALSDGTAAYMNKGIREAWNIGHYPVKCDFDYQIAYTVNNDWMVRSEEARQFALKHYANVASDIHFMLTKRP